MTRINRETAEADFDKFVELLKMSELKLAKMDEEKEDIIQLIEYGYLSIGDEIAAYLETPLANGTGNEIEHVVFKNRRYTVKEIENLTKGTTSDMEAARRLLGSLIGMNSGLLKEMDSEDFTNLGKISAFFLPR